MRSILAIDPGTEVSGMALHKTPRQPVAFRVLSNKELALKMVACGVKPKHYDHVAIELYISYGMPTGEDSILTVVWTGIFSAIALFINRCKVSFIYRRTVATELTGRSTAGDPEINCRLRDIYGKPGTKKDPGLLYGIKSHAWAALAVATAVEDKYPTGELGFMTLLPSGDWEDQDKRDELAALKKRKKAKTREKNKKRKEDEFSELDWQVG